MPCSAAALVTSGSFAAPSSIEYSVWTCRCTNESVDGVLLTVAACSSQVVRARPSGIRRGRPAGKTGGAVVRGVRAGGCPDPRTTEVYSGGPTERCLATGGPIRHGRPGRASAEVAAHRDVRDAGLLVLVADRGVARPFVEPPGGDLRVQLDLRQAPAHRLAVQLGQDGGA